MYNDCIIVAQIIWLFLNPTSWRVIQVIAHLKFWLPKNSYDDQSADQYVEYSFTCMQETRY